MTKEKYSCVVFKLDLNQRVLKIKERGVPSAVSQIILHETMSEYLSNRQ